MRIISDALYSNLYNGGLGIYRFDNIRRYHKGLILCISKRHRKAYRQYEKIPRQLLKIWRDLGLLPFEIKCDRAIQARKISYLLENGTYREKNHFELGMWLSDRIREEIFMSRRPCIHSKKHTGGSEKFIGRGKNALPQFFLRNLPGSIIQ
jgi:hypothetical protein